MILGMCTNEHILDSWPHSQKAKALNLLSRGRELCIRNPILKDELDLNTKLCSTVGNFLFFSFWTDEFYPLSLSFRIHTHNILLCLVAIGLLLVSENTFMPVISDKSCRLPLPSARIYHKQDFPACPSMEQSLTETPRRRQKVRLKQKTKALVPASIICFRTPSVWFFPVSEKQKGMQKLGVGGR